MRRLTQTVLTALLVAGLASTAQAQMMGGTAPPDTTGAKTTTTTTTTTTSTGAAAATTAAAAPQAPASGGEKWTYLIAPYFLAPNMNGTTGVGPVSIEVDETPSDIFSHLQFGFMIYMEARKGPLAFGLDILYMNLGQDGFTALGTYTVDMKQSGYMATIYRRLGPRLEASLGATLNHLSAGLETTGPVAIDNDESKTWVDPMVGLRVELLKSPKWGLMFSGGVGGFGIGSDFAWQAYPILCWHAESDLDIGVAYRAFGMDYKSGSGNEEFVYDIVTFGPEIGIGFHF